MVIRPMAAAYTMGEIGRSAGSTGAKGGPAAFFATQRDTVELHSREKKGAGLYRPSPWFKMVGAVELMTTDADPLELPEDSAQGMVY